MPKQRQSNPVHVMDAGEEEVRAQLALIAERRSDRTIGFDKDMAMATAALARALVGFENERRQKVKAEARALASFPLDAVIEYLKSLSDEQRRGIVDDLTGAAAERGLL